MSSEALEKQAEDFRLQGNDAFGTKDYKRALDLYQKSVGCHPMAKSYANIAATLCKLGEYDEAAQAAERATALDPSWAKGWWRRGVVSDLQKTFYDSVKYYEIAVEISPKEKAFSKSLNEAKKRLNIKEKAGRGKGG